MRRAVGVLTACVATVFGTMAPVSKTMASDTVRVSHASADCIGAITDAVYEGETTRYAHGVLGDAVEWTTLTVVVETNGTCRWGTNQLSVELSESRVFEDTAPRLADLDGDGLAEVITVESDLRKGARLTVWGKRGDRFRRVASTPFIGRAHRWLAPVGAADLDGDGVMELAYVDRPHLAKTLRVWRFQGDQLREVGNLRGVTNHRIGEDYISGGIRDCGQGPEMIVADAGWTQMLAIRFDGRNLTYHPLGRFSGRQGFARALACRAD